MTDRIASHCTLVAICCISQNVMLPKWPIRSLFAARGGGQSGTPYREAFVLMPSLSAWVCMSVVSAFVELGENLSPWPQPTPDNELKTDGAWPIRPHCI